MIRLLEAGLAENEFDVLPAGQLSAACARWNGPDELQSRIAAEIIASGDAWFSTVKLGGRTWLRFNLLNLYTRDNLIQRMTETARRLGRHEQQ